ncbi:hypothetical protein [Embleya sp. NPDC005971]|uniref:hypothetical protein n=1 Tax=Embleya sp. NPDC005971 TaxID=3156724 RepID=UPI0033D07D31
MATQHQPGEIAVQERAGPTRRASHAPAGIGDTIPPVAVAFLADQPVIIVGGTDRAGRIRATQPTGAPGFLRVPHPGTLCVDALPIPEDPPAELLRGRPGSA